MVPLGSIQVLLHKYSCLIGTFEYTNVVTLHWLKWDAVWAKVLPPSGGKMSEWRDGGMAGRRKERTEGWGGEGRGREEGEGRGGEEWGGEGRSGEGRGEEERGGEGREHHIMAIEALVFNVLESSLVTLHYG